MNSDRNFIFNGKFNNKQGVLDRLLKVLNKTIGNYEANPQSTSTLVRKTAEEFRFFEKY